MDDEKRENRLISKQLSNRPVSWAWIKSDLYVQAQAWTSPRPEPKIMVIMSCIFRVSSKKNCIFIQGTRNV